MPLVNVQDIMTKDVVSVHPGMSLLDAAKILSVRNFDGVPVVDMDNKLVGIFTEYDLISKESMIHLPTFQKILQNIKVFKQDQSEFQKEIQEISVLTVRDVMNDDPLTLSQDATFIEVLDAFRSHHRVNPIPVVDAKRKVVGVVSRFDVLKPLPFINSHT